MIPTLSKQTYGSELARIEYLFALFEKYTAPVLGVPQTKELIRKTLPD